MKAVSAIFAIAFALALQGAFGAAYAGSSSTGGHCTGMTVTDYVTSEAASVTTSTTWQNVIDAHLNFTTSSTGCVIITFAGPADVAAPPNDYVTMHVRTLLDENNLCAMAGYDDRFAEQEAPVPLVASSITRTCKNVPAGAHSLQVQFHGDDGIHGLNIYGFVLTVSHT